MKRTERSASGATRGGVTDRGGRASGLVPLPRVPDWERARAALAAHGVSALSPGDVGAVSAVSLVGDGLTQDGRVARAALGAARDEGVTPRALTSTPFRVTVVVPAGAADALTRRLHARFCEA